MTKIIVDGFGGDNAPDEVLKGCRQAADQWDIQVILSGDEQALRRSGLRVRREYLPLYLALILADSRVDERLDYPAAEELREMAAHLP